MRRKSPLRAETVNGWLRDHFIRWPPDNILLLIAGRYKLKGTWIMSPALRECLLFMPLGNLDAFRKRSLAVIVPIDRSTLPVLLDDPFANPYLSSLSREALKASEVDSPDKAGWFIRTIDYADWENPECSITVETNWSHYFVSVG
ncbi:hypothetical protein [Paenibacillus oryzisoli]|uniref:Uncharacterized protein n=1 Tax=Paenibacillus oryzisoli TaxID=1850517 RepID=A0A198APZ2_9BACL|nr:hypothetical protein [Paenibacillus oryzisoli]OAS23619.1 hypothetical protein A8708_31760 [Paenibacillus oryzisoli]